MKLKKLLPALITAALLVFTFLFPSCQKEPDQNSGVQDVESLSDMVVASNFNYETTRIIHYDFTSEELFGKEKIKIQMFDMAPEEGGKLLTGHFMDLHGKLSGKLCLPADVKSLFVEKMNPNGGTESSKLEVDGSSVSHIFPLANSNGSGSQQQDSDFDGVPDHADLFPQDAMLASAEFYPASGSFATLAFEDLWPGRGDYDFNDLVVDYQHSFLTNSSNEVIRIESKFIVRAIGGTFSKGLGFQLDLPPNMISQVIGAHLTENTVNTNFNGTEVGQSLATIMVFDNAFETVDFAPGALFVNTFANDPWAASDTITLQIHLAEPQKIDNLGVAPFNPFIFIDHDRSKEIHLPNQPPTDLADFDFFGQSSDDSNPAEGRFYKSDKNHPWAMNMVGGFEWPTEKNDIVLAYSTFDNWAQSAGAEAMDWYSVSNPARDVSKIY